VDHAASGNVVRFDRLAFGYSWGTKPEIADDGSMFGFGCVTDGARIVNPGTASPIFGGGVATGVSTSKLTVTIPGGMDGPRRVV
jgi:hypothetical protein